MKSRGKDRTWWIAGIIFVVAIAFAATCQVRDYAFLKADLAEYFILQNEKTDLSLSVLFDAQLFQIFCSYCVVYLAAVPILLQKLSCRIWWILIFLFALFYPALWYVNQINHIAWKILDWGALGI